MTAANHKVDPADPSFRMEDWPLYWITRVGRQYTMDLDAALKRVGMDVTRWRVLMILNQLGPASVTTLADHAVIKLPTMTKTVGRMENDGLVTTAEDARDRRVTIVTATKAGSKATHAVRQQASRLFRNAFSDISGNEAQALVVVLRKVYANLANDPES